MHCMCLCLIDTAMMQVVGAFEKDNQKLPHTLTGKWDTALEALMADGTKQTIWKVHPLPKVTSRYWPCPHKESGVSLCNPAFMLLRIAHQVFIRMCFELYYHASLLVVRSTTSAFAMQNCIWLMCLESQINAIL